MLGSSERMVHKCRFCLCTKNVYAPPRASLQAGAPQSPTHYNEIQHAKIADVTYLELFDIVLLLLLLLL